MAPKVTVPEVRSSQAGARPSRPRHAHRLRHPRGPHRRRGRGRHDPGGRLPGQQRARPGRHPPGGRGRSWPTTWRRWAGPRPGPWWWATCPGSATTCRWRTPSATPPVLVRAGRPGREARGRPGPGAHDRGPHRHRDPRHGPPGPDAPVGPRHGRLQGPGQRGRRGRRPGRRRQGHRGGGVLRHGPRGGARRRGGPGHRRGRRPHHRHRGRGRPATARSWSSTTSSAWGRARCPSSSAGTPTWPLSPWRPSRPGPTTSGRGRSPPTPRPTTSPPSRAPGATDPPVRYHGRWSRTGSPSGSGRPSEPCSAGWRSPACRVARVQREVSRACGRTKQWSSSTPRSKSRPSREP